MKINENDKLYGFTAVSIDTIKEIEATLVDMRHDKSGARLLLLDRRDDNATFTIAFKTTPTDDTGVFHILEHSVLCGSKKFPIKDPFTELSKNTVSTYLNALTSGDKTLYPVSSKNPKSFHGLVDVYLDAVFNPLALDNPFIFMQEGHRYELDGDGKLTESGIVYNEMQGVYASADDYADYLISGLVCPNGTYSYDAGGHPDFIPELSFEDFKKAHEKFYHPSNAYLFLDGDVDLDDILPLIDGYLKEYDKRECDIEINNGGDTITDIIVDTYPIEVAEGIEDKTKVYLCYNTYAHGDTVSNALLSAVTEVLADTNNAPLTKTVLDTGLCEGFNFFCTGTYAMNSLNVFFSGVKDGKEEEVIRVFKKAINDIIKSGIPRDIISSAIKRREFKLREADFGANPRGMMYMRWILENAMLGESPAQSLKYTDMINILREKLDTPCYEDVLRRVISSPHATLILHPDPDFNAKREREKAERLNAILSKMTAEEKAELKAQNEAFRIWQQTPDTEQALKTIPSISREDLNTVPKNIPIDVISYGGREIISHPLYTGGITYLYLFFDVSDASEDELHHLALFVDTVFEWDTENGSAEDFKNQTKAHLGSFIMTFHRTVRNSEPKLYLMLMTSCLEDERDSALALIEEYLYRTLYDDKEILESNVRQLSTYLSEDFAARGLYYAGIRCAARLYRYDAICEHTNGYEYLSFLKNILSRGSEGISNALDYFKKTVNKYFRRERLTVSVTDSCAVEFAKRVIDVVHSGGEAAGASEVGLLPRINEGICLPTSVSFTNYSGSYNGDYSGVFNTLSSIASLELLWNEIRIKNGAYDAGFTVYTTGTVSCHSYRDPSPALSIEYYKRVCDDIDAFLDTDPDLFKYIIGVFGATDTVTTARKDGFDTTKRYLAGRTYEDTVKRREQCLNTTKEDLKAANAAVREALANATFTVAGPREELERIEGIDKILEL